ncbi:cbb3-type cytochrome oxidase subunit 3 [Lysobacter solisilvae (ex Woo and Kim 2020)]|uniref:Cbb3-type cytochrome c oxidase subunit 3 n=1 Tax=Agrilutibacter terrestris TaxID=2865112 RepID=A0A7H0FWK1_9GAMM|nr:cbb3-type cytochrome c oxidase subunit 3 [Lysobacter terrestris]QNP40417.1 cbb3-type cytochrome c oxidase subunit 3 [Lysobacter terrestris]
MVSGIITATLLVVFVAGWAWAWSPRRRRDFEEAARLPLDDGPRAVDIGESER